MENPEFSEPSQRGVRLADTQMLLAEMERLELRAQMLLVEHRHVVGTIREMQRQLDAVADSVPRRDREAGRV
jgi:hypothetical protein